MRSGLSAAGWLLGGLLASAAFAAHAPRVVGDLAEEIDAGKAILALKSDPNLTRRQKTVRRLTWKDEAPPPPKSALPDGLEAFFEFLAGSARLLMWLLGGLVASLAVIWVSRAVRQRGPHARQIAAPTRAAHVHPLDVRPASLPADIGAAAAGLVAAGQLREALSLLYRGALARAIHRHGIAIAASSTEGEVLAAITSHLPSTAGQYFGRLVTLWQRAAYAAEPPGREAVADLCRDFAELEGATA